MDKYTKFILTIIAIGVIGINVHFFKDDLISSANAEVAGMNSYDLSSDYDFKKAVRRVVSRSCYVEGEYIYCWIFDLNS